jgi:serine/threonine protein phosphatase PrpC
MTDTIRVHVAAYTHPGRVRPHNEDCIAVGDWLQQGTLPQPRGFTHTLEQPLLCLVADGLGGHAAGEVASRYAAKRLSATIATQGSDEDVLTQVLHQIHDELHTQMASDPVKQGMGTTVAGLILTLDGALAFNVGDSRLYYRPVGGELFQVSEDDTPEALYGGEFQHFRSHVITQCLGGYDAEKEILPHLAQLPLQTGDYYVLCSDGVTDMVKSQALADSLTDDLEQTAQALFQQAMDAGGEDNISLVLVRVEEAAD